MDLDFATAKLHKPHSAWPRRINGGPGSKGGAQHDAQEYNNFSKAVYEIEEEEKITRFT